MQFSKVIISGLVATTAVSSSPIVTEDLVKKDVVDTVLGDVESLLGTVVTDVTKLLADAGVNVTSILEPILAPLDLKKRDAEATKLEARDLDTLVGDVDKLVSDLLKGVGKLTADLVGL
ncbi:hypothetical protein FDK38_000538 [Candidozyma auris]|nr:hypothetical protein FDK38_000538 [[Candida] auris]